MSAQSGEEPWLLMLLDSTAVTLKRDLRCTGVKLRSLALIAFVAACSGPATPQAGAASPGPSISPTAVSSPGTTWSLGLGSTAISTVDFSCRLPVFVDQGLGSRGALIDFPSGTATSDPTAAEVDSITPTGRELVGNSYVHYYDRAYSRWVPVTRDSVSPDGAHYAYTDRAVGDRQNPQARATLHVVTVTTGVELLFDDGPWSAPYVVLDYAAEGIYLMTTFAVNTGLWLMDPSTGAVIRVANLSNIQGSAGNNVFWVGAANRNDPHPVHGAPNELDRLNRVEGSRVAWFYRPGSGVHFVSQDVAGHPIIVVGSANGPGELVIVLGPGIGRSILLEGDKVPSLASPISDNHGVWFGSPDGIFLYSEANGLQKVSNQPGYPANGCL
jgi:hypothetical protein